jgi:citrate synthase
MGDHLDVDPAALEAFAKTSDGRRRSFDQLRRQVDQAHVASDSFGRIPGIGHRIYQAYDQHVRECADGVSSAAEAMAAIASGVRGTVATYRKADSTTEDATRAVQNSMGDISIRGT